MITAIAYTTKGLWQEGKNWLGQGYVEGDLNTQLDGICIIGQPIYQPELTNQERTLVSRYLGDFDTYLVEIRDLNDFQKLVFETVDCSQILFENIKGGFSTPDGMNEIELCDWLV